MKKIVSITLMLAMILALSVSAFAETPASQNMEVSYVVDSHYVIVIPDGGNDLIVDPDTGEGDMDIGVKPESVFPGDKALQMSVNAGKHYDDTAKTYRLLNGTGGQLLNYVLSYKGQVKNPNVSTATVVLETVAADDVYLGFQGKIGVKVGTAKAAGTYTDTLTFSIAYNIAFLPPESQGHVADLIGINVRVSNENTTVLKSLAKTEKLDYDKIRDVLEGRYPPPKVVEQPKPAEPAPLPSMAPTSIPKSPDVSAGAAPRTVIPVPPPMAEPKPVTTPAVPAPSASPAEKPDRENSYVTKVILTGDRLRKYFPDVSMTPRQIENSVYDALEERRQRLEKARQKSEIFTR